MAVVKFSRTRPLGKSNEVEALKEEITTLKRDLEYILNHLDKQNFTQEFVKQNNLK